jgi:serine/threonine-protein kinase
MGLSPDQLVRMSRLLDEALPLDEPGRRAWLARLAPEHADIAAALREALQPRTGPSGAEFMSTLPKLEAGGEPDSTPASGLKPGAHVGPYELLRPLGAGGMAEVWLARRADGAFKRDVALNSASRASATFSPAWSTRISRVSTTRESMWRGCRTCRWSTSRGVRS